MAGSIPRILRSDPVTAKTAPESWLSVARRRLDLPIRMGKGMRDHGAFLAAPAMAFHFFLSLVPLLVAVGYVVGHFVRKSGIEVILGPLQDVAPEGTLLLVQRELVRLASAKATPAPLAVLTFAWLASSGLHAFIAALESTSNAPRRPWIQKRAIAIGWLLVGLAAVSSFAWTIVRASDLFPNDPSLLAREVREAEDARASRDVRDARNREGHEREAHEGVRDARGVRGTASSKNPLLRKPVTASTLNDGRVLGTLAVLAITPLLAGFYRTAVRRPKDHVRRVWPGAVLAVVMWLLITWIFGIYVAQIARYSTFYGSVATVAVLLVWFWLTSLSLLVGAELNAQLEGIRKQHPT
jgi:uncharacterized BrkB/YihY/UPF0761 family membrane protein